MQYRFSAGRARGVRGVHRAAARAAALRQRPLDPQRARPRAAAPGDAAVRVARAARRPRRADDDRGRRHPAEPRVRRGATTARTRAGRGRRNDRPRKDADRVHHRGAAPLSAGHRGLHRAAQLRAARVQAHQLPDRARRAGRRAGQDGHGQRAGRGAGAARRDGERHLPAHQRVRRPPRGDGVGGDGRAVRDSAGVSARQVPARVRPARRVEQRRRQPVGRQHLLGAARAGRRSASRSPPTSCSRARSSCAPATRSTGRRRCSC